MNQAFTSLHTLKQTDNGYEVCFINHIDGEVTPIFAAMPLDRACHALLWQEQEAKNPSNTLHTLYFKTDKDVIHAAEYDTWASTSAAFINLISLYLWGELNLVSIRVDLHIDKDEVAELDLNDLLADFARKKPTCDMLKLKALLESSQAAPL